MEAEKSYYWLFESWRLGKSIAHFQGNSGLRTREPMVLRPSLEHQGTDVCHQEKMHGSGDAGGANFPSCIFVLFLL
jgi:hypothetical protein